MSLSGTVTLAKITLTLTDGSAFFDTSVANTDYINNIGSKLTITDSSSKTVVGYIKETSGTGVKVGNASGAQSWGTKDAGFNGADAGGYTYTITAFKRTRGIRRFIDENGNERTIYY